MDIFHGLDDDTGFERRAAGDENAPHRRVGGIVAVIAFKEGEADAFKPPAALHVPTEFGHDPDGRDPRVALEAKRRGQIGREVGPGVR